MSDRQNILHSIDWWTIGIYVALLVFGWVSVCGASYTYGDTEIFSLATRSGMQMVWIGTSVVLALLIMLLDDRFYDTFAYVIYAVLLILLFATIFNPHEIKGSRSWLVIYGPLRFQPAEFAKFATALAAAKLMSSYGFDIHRWKHFAAACAVVVVPILLIVAQKETGSALVYMAFFLMFYREGMTGSVLFAGIAMVVYFVVGVRYGGVMLPGTLSPLGKVLVLLLVQVFTSILAGIYCRAWRQVKLFIAVSLTLTAVAVAVSSYIIAFDVTWVQLVLCAALAIWLFYMALGSRLRAWLLILLFEVASAGLFYSADYVLNNVLQAHQRTRINVLLGLEEDLAGAGYNVHQSEIAIGSGGLTGKGFLNGTQTKLKCVPEQDTDFIFCTVGEEEGFIGCAVVLMLFLALILRLIKLAERQPYAFGRVYGYCVLSIFLFHVFINVGMVIGLTPVIGIPLPFFSYGGSSLWGFTILLFIFLRIDAGRNRTKM